MQNAARLSGAAGVPAKPAWPAAAVELGAELLATTAVGAAHTVAHTAAGLALRGLAAAVGQDRDTMARITSYCDAVQSSSIKWP